MLRLDYITSNPVKFNQAAGTCQKYGIELAQVTLDITEIQSEDGEIIARDKAAHAFSIRQTPLIISDDVWNFPGLNGFPGPYMKSINVWFETQDWLNLTRDLTDRRAIVTQTVVYIDQHDIKLFSKEVPGEILREARGNSNYASHCVLSFDGGHMSVAEHEAAQTVDAALLDSVWLDFARWYSETHGSNTT